MAAVILPFEEALFLTNFASEVTLVHRRDTLRAEKIGQDRLFKNPKIKVIWDSVIEEITGTEETVERYRCYFKKYKNRHDNKTRD